MEFWNTKMKTQVTSHGDLRLDFRLILIFRTCEQSLLIFLACYVSNHLNVIPFSYYRAQLHIFEWELQQQQCLQLFIMAVYNFTQDPNKRILHCWKM